MLRGSCSLMSATSQALVGRRQRDDRLPTRAEGSGGSRRTASTAGRTATSASTSSPATTRREPPIHALSPSTEGRNAISNASATMFWHPTASRTEPGLTSRGRTPRPAPRRAARSARRPPAAQSAVELLLRRGTAEVAEPARPVEPTAAGLRRGRREEGGEGRGLGGPGDAEGRQPPDHRISRVSASRPISGRDPSRLVGATPGWERLLVIPQPCSLLRRSSSSPKSPRAIFEWL